MITVYTNISAVIMGLRRALKRKSEKLDAQNSASPKPKPRLGDCDHPGAGISKGTKYVSACYGLDLLQGLLQGP